MTGSLPPNEPHEPTEPNQPDEAGVAGSVTGEWVEVYQPDGAPQEEEPLVPAVSARRFGVTVIVLFVGALLLVIVGSVTPLFNAAIPLFGGDSSFANANTVLSADAWQLTTVDSSFNTTSPTRTIGMPVPIGYPLALAALLLLAVLALWLRVGQQPGAVRIAKPVGLAAAAFLAGLAFALGMFELAWSGLGSTALLGGLSTSVGLGYWMLAAAAAVGIVAAVLGYRVPMPEEPVPAPGQWDPQPPSAAEQVPPGQPAQWPVVAVIPADEKTNW